MAETTAGSVRVLTVTISDLRKRFADELGKRLGAELTGAGFTVVRHATVADEPGHISELVRSSATGNGADAIVLSGGTGINPRDQTFEALEGLYEKRIEGFGEAFRRLAYDAMGPRAIYFRASAGVFEQVPIYSLPGNAQAMLIGLRQLVIPTLVGAVDMAAGRETHTVGPSAMRADRLSGNDVSQLAADRGSQRDVSVESKRDGDAPR
jgi:molybdenum cofactor biosynthesis protein B